MRHNDCDARVCVGAKVCEQAASELARDLPGAWRLGVYAMPCEFVELDEAE